MKLNEIINQFQLDWIYQWLHKIAPSIYQAGYYAIDRNDGTVRLSRPNIDAVINDSRLKDGKLPIKFSTAECEFRFARCKTLISLEGCPTKTANFGILNCSQISDLTGAPSEINGDFNITGSNKITSLIGIADKIKMITGDFIFNPTNIKEGGLGLLNIERLNNLIFIGSENVEPFAIINKYLGHSDKIFECQNELIDAGFDDYALV